MATCKDCIHYDVCQYHIDEETDMTITECGKFKNKSVFEEVVRCDNCKHNVANKEIDTLDETDYSGEDIVCSYFMTDGLAPNDFCSYGERKRQGGQDA